MPLDDYFPLREVGRGGFGLVLRGRSPKDGSDVAVKILVKADQRRHLARFDREKRLLEELNETAGFIPLLDSGDSPQGPYFVMPFLEGGTLRDKLRRGPLRMGESVALGIALAGAVGRAHAAGIVHRDLKPENVLYTKEGRALIADLGLAKHFRHDDPDVKSLSLSNPGTAIGTLGYMAPEQMRDAKSAGPAADVFSLGAILYECLSGDRLYKAATVLDLVRIVEEGQHEPLSKSIPEWLRDIVEKAIETHADERYPDGAALAAALRAGAMKTRSSRRGTAVAAGVILGALGTLAAIAHVSGQVPLPPKPEPIAAVASALSAAVGSAAIAETAPVPSAAPDPAEEKPGKKERALLEQAEQAAGAGKKKEAYEAYLELGRLAQEKKHPKLAVKALGAAVVLASKKSEELAALTDLGYVEVTLTGAYEDACVHLRRAVTLSLKDPLLRNNLGYALHMAGRDSEALVEYRRCVDLDPEYTLARLSLGNIARTSGSAKEALAVHRDLLSVVSTDVLGGGWNFRFESQAFLRKGSVALSTPREQSMLVRLEIALDKVYLDDLAGMEKSIADARKEAFDPVDLHPGALKVLDDIERALEQEPDRYALHYLAGILHSLRGEKDPALQHLQAFRKREAEHDGPFAEKALELMEKLK